ncbi:MAG TPA: pantoate--beta-alanine ligase [Gammaproteobacteria bacterium]|nr:pantoate--beta-alanine ligase [Gammaproteobacteria bacterium]
MQTVKDPQQLRTVLHDWRQAGQRVALVPTMGNLHDGHLSLLDRARAIADRTVVSIFVNPIQFGKGEDYARYPSTLEQDGAKLAAKGLDLLFAPNLDDLYPGGMDRDTRVSVPILDHILCGAFRPGHFSGVATVVTKLFIMVQPDVALFGEKDYQQVLVIKRMVHDLCIPVEIVAHPIVREPDGLAMSSRNAYLNPEERKKATLIYKVLSAAATMIENGDLNYQGIEAEAMASLARAGFRPEYASIRRNADLAMPETCDRELRILAAAWLGSARLIDNVAIHRKK